MAGDVDDRRDIGGGGAAGVDEGEADRDVTASGDLGGCGEVRGDDRDLDAGGGELLVGEQATDAGGAGAVGGTEQRLAVGGVKADQVRGVRLAGRGRFGLRDFGGRGPGR